MEGQTILVVLPHPDDEAFGAAGTLARRIQEGARVTYACLTLGEMGRNMGIPPFANRVTLANIRKEELYASCRMIGIRDVRLLGFRDKTIEFEPHEALDEPIGELLRELRPSLVITFYPGYSVHPDHNATGAAVVRSVARLPEGERPIVHGIAFDKAIERDIGPADVVVDVRDYLEQKIGAILSHRTQFQAEELLGARDPGDREVRERFGTERYWICPIREQMEGLAG